MNAVLHPRSKIATVNQRVTRQFGGTTPLQGFFFAKEARKN